MHTRGYVIEQSAQIERLASVLLAGILDVDLNTSKMFGKNSNLGFQKKLEIISEFKTIDSSVSRIMKLFSQIRNQFAHNIDVNSFEELFILKPDIERQLNELYSTDQSKTKEEIADSLYGQLYRDVLTQFKIQILTLNFNSNQHVGVEIKMKCQACGNIYVKNSKVFVGYHSTFDLDQYRNSLLNSNFLETIYCPHDGTITFHKMEDVILKKPSQK